MSARPSVTLVRGEALNPFELQVYAPITQAFAMTAVGRRKPPYEVDHLPVPTMLLPSLGQWRLSRAVHRRLVGRGAPWTDPDRLLGFGRRVGRQDILHAAETVLPVTEQAAEAAVRTGAKLVVTCWETIPFRYDDDPALAARKVKVRAAATRYVAVTRRARDALLTEGVHPDRITVVPAAVDCQVFRPGDRSGQLRRELGWPSGGPTVLYVGRLIQEKGVVELVRAFALAAPRHARLVIVGNGNQGGRVAIAAREAGIAERVHVRPGLPYRRLPELYDLADLVVAPSLTTPYWEEQFGMVLAEAMACGRPLLTTRSGAIPEVVGPAAELVDPYDVAGLAGALCRLLHDGARRAELSAAGRVRALEHYDVPVVAAQLEQVYREVLDS